jgi:hypothetical protein
MDTVIKVGCNLVDGGDIVNSRFCQVKKGEMVIKYSPDEVKEYGFKSGRTYRSFAIPLNDQTNRYFLERLVNGKVNLYYLKAEISSKKYYLMLGDSADLIEIPTNSDEYTLLFERYAGDCPQAVKNIPFVKLRKNSLRRFISDYNGCVNRPFPVFHFGFTIGMTSTLLSPADKGYLYSIPDFHRDWGISIRAFADVPVHSGNFSFHPEIYYKQNGISTTFSQNNYANDLVINYSSISLPLLIRYSLLGNNITPYLQAGPAYSRIIRNDGTLYKYESVNNNVFVDIADSQMLQKDMGGFSVGSGLIIKYGSKYAWFCELSYTKFYNLSDVNQFINISEINLVIGLLFRHS